MKKLSKPTKFKKIGLILISIVLLSFGFLSLVFLSVDYCEDRSRNITAPHSFNLIPGTQLERDRYHMSSFTIHYLEQLKCKSKPLLENIKLYACEKTGGKFVDDTYGCIFSSDGTKICQQAIKPAENSCVYNNTSIPNVTPTPIDTEELEVRNLVQSLENYIQDRKQNALISLFTPPKTQEEITSYKNLMGQEPNIGIPRLFNNVSSNFIVTNWSISRRQTDNKELIRKINDKYYINLEETRKNWCNTDPCAGTYSFEHTNYYVLEIINFDSHWKIDKYYTQVASPEKE